MRNLGLHDYCNIPVACAILNSCENMREKVAVIQVDLDKSFDRTSNQFLFKLLDHVTVGGVVLDGVQLCYRGCFTQLIVNRTLSRPIPPVSSVKQGCPFSLLLFAAYLEPLCRNIVSSASIIGYKRSSSELNVLAYSGDLAFLCADKKNVSSALMLTEQFCAITGALIKKFKCSWFWFGCWCTTLFEYAGIDWSNVPRQYLGVPLNCYKNGSLYWTPRVLKLH